MNQIKHEESPIDLAKHAAHGQIIVKSINEISEPEGLMDPDKKQ